MTRTIATLPDDIEELCLLRLGIQTRGWRAALWLRSLTRPIHASIQTALRSDSGLLHSESFRLGSGHHGFLQYWRSFQALEVWSHSEPHTTWWRDLNQRSRQREDVGIYHEVYLVPRRCCETIYLNCTSVGMSAFGVLGEPVGSRTTARDRLGLRNSPRY